MKVLGGITGEDAVSLFRLSSITKIVHVFIAYVFDSCCDLFT